MANNRSMKDKEMAAYLKKKGVKRTTGMCPMGCGRALTVGGAALTSHLNVCHGPYRGPRKAR